MRLFASFAVNLETVSTSAFLPKALNCLKKAGLLAFPTFADLLIPTLGTMV